MNRYRRLGIFAVVLAALVGLTGIVVAQETGYVLRWHSFTGGGVSTGGGYTLRASMGESVAGVSSGGGMTLVAGAPVSNFASTPTNTPIDTSTDQFEPDNTCATARWIEVGALAQTRTLGNQTDEDWVKFQARGGVLYRIDASVHQGSTADLILEGYLECEGEPAEADEGAFGAGGRIEWRAPADSVFWLRIVGGPESGFGPNARYELTVSVVQEESVQSGAVIIMAGVYKRNDPLTPNIREVTKNIYRTFIAYGYTDESIYLISSDTALSGTYTGPIDAPGTAAELREAITSWALPRVGPDRALTLYMVDHGGKDVFYIDRPNGQSVTTQQLAEWLDQVTQAKPTAPVNVIIEACNAGSFISGNSSISGINRVIITSTSDQNLAYASSTGAHFSDHFLVQLARGVDLLNSFVYARNAVRSDLSTQDPWLDDNGDGVFNLSSDGLIARNRGFGIKVGLDDDDLPPYVKQVVAPETINDHRGFIRAQVIDNDVVDVVYAIVYSPSYEPPEDGEELAPEPQSVVPLIATEDNWYAGEYTEFTEQGVYRIVVYARDSSGLKSLPVIVEVANGSAVYLPMVTR